MGKGAACGPILFGPVRPIRGRIRGKGCCWARKVSVGPRRKRKIGLGMLLSVARITGGARVAATVGLATTMRVTVATTMVGRAAVVKMS